MDSPSILFVHTNFPAQFGTLSAKLSDDGWKCVFATAREGVSSQAVRVVRFAEGRTGTAKVHPYVAGFEGSVIKGQEAARTFLQLRNRGFKPDVIMAHSGWGVGMFAKDIFPDAVYVPYVEWWYRYPPIDSTFLGDHTPSIDTHLRQRVRNAPMLMDMQAATRSLCPTVFQASQFPNRLREQIEILHDGIDTRLHAPAAQRPDRVGELDISAMPEIVTYATRGMEPHRGFPTFMRALGILQKRRPGLHALILGEDRVAYGAKLPEGESWKARMLAEVSLDLDRVHFTGRVDRPSYIAALQASQAHVYLTAPFVLSWSMLEAMSIGVPLIASDNAPVWEFAKPGVSAQLVDFHDPNAVADAAERYLDNPDMARSHGKAARRVIVENYGFEDLVERKKRWLTDLINDS